MSISGNQLDRLGRRLAQDAPAIGDARLLQSWVFDHNPALLQVKATLADGLPIDRWAAVRRRVVNASEPMDDDPLGDAIARVFAPDRPAESLERFAATVRLKSMGSIQAKLRRLTTSLRQMDDIGGARIIVGDSLLHQNAVLDAIAERFPGSTLKDRRDDPSGGGYRAAHVIVSIDGMRTEIQVRTWLQHFYAEMMEKLADLVGRGIRYGDPPERTRLPGVLIPSRTAVRRMLELSDAIAGHERGLAAIELVTEARERGVEVEEHLRVLIDKAAREQKRIEPLLNATRWMQRRAPSPSLGEGDHVLMIYLPDTQELVAAQEFTSYAEALAARAEREARMGTWSEGTEVVVLSASSIEDVKTTHGRYFLSLDDLGFAAADP